MREACQAKPQAHTSEQIRATQNEALPTTCRLQLQPILSLMAGTGWPAACVHMFCEDNHPQGEQGFGPLNSRDICGCINNTGPCFAPAQRRCSSAGYGTVASGKLACLKLPYASQCCRAPCGALNPGSTAVEAQGQISSTTGKVLQELCWQGCQSLHHRHISTALTQPS